MGWWQDLEKAVSTYYTDAWAAATGGGVSNASGDVSHAASAAGGALSGASGISALIGGIWSNLRDYKMWRSLGWLLLGIVLMLLAVAWWIGPSAARRSPIAVAAGGLG